MDVEQFRDAVFRLSREEKIRLAQQLWDDIAREPELFPMPSGLFDELQRRRLALEADPTRAIAWNDAKRIIRESVHG